MEDGFFDGAGGPGLGGVDEGGKDGAGEWAEVVGAFGMPLDAEDEVGGAVELNGFDDAVGGAGGDADVVAGGGNGLVVAAVHICDGACRPGSRFAWLFRWSVTREIGIVRAAIEFVVDVGNVGGWDESGEAGVGGDFEGVGFVDGAAWFVVEGVRLLGGNVLEEGAAAPDVEGLGSVADAEDGFVEVEGVLEEKLVDGFAGGVGGSALGEAVLRVFLGLDVGTAAGEEDAVDGGEDFGDALGGFVEGDEDGSGSGGVERVEILREGAGVVGEGVFGVLRAGGLGNGDADGHVGSLVDECIALEGVGVGRGVRGEEPGVRGYGGRGGAAARERLGKGGWGIVVIFICFLRGILS